MDTRHAVDRLGNLAGRHVFALPAERVADPVDEVEIAVAVSAHQVAGAKPDVALFEYVTQDLVLVLRACGVSLETVARPGGVVDDATDHFARLVRVATLAEALRVADRLLALDVEAHHRD